MDVLLELISDVWNVTCELAPWLLIGAGLSGVIHLFLPQSTIQRYLNGRSGVLRAVLFGIPLPLCSCGVVPAGIGLKKDGASDGAAIGFLIATPQTGVDSIIASAGILGWPFAVFKVVAALITGIVGGYATELIGGSKQVAPKTSNIGGAKRAVRFRDGVSHSIEIIRSIWLWLVIGILVSVLISRAMSGFVSEVGEAGIVASTLLALVVSLPLYVCATASLPIAAQLIENGLPVGAALVFLMAGPATNAATVGAIRSQFGWRQLAVYLATIIVFSMLFAAVFEAFFSTNLSAELPHVHEHATWWHQVSAIVLISLILKFAWRDLRNAFKSRTVSGDRTGWRISIEGMTCRNCAKGLTKSLNGVPGVSAVEVTLDPDEALVNGACTESDLRAAVQKSGFQVTHLEALSKPQL